MQHVKQRNVVAVLVYEVHLFQIQILNLLPIQILNLLMYQETNQVIILGFCIQMDSSTQFVAIISGTMITVQIHFAVSLVTKMVEYLEKEQILSSVQMQ